MFGLDAERAHELGIAALQSGLARPFYKQVSDRRFGDLHRFGLNFANPLGLAAGFDKNGAAVNALASLGFGSIEVGTVTLEPQAGNPKPRLFRLPEQQALINRLGFNNAGARKIAEELSQIERKCIVGVNIGRNRNVPNEEAVENYVECLKVVHGVADYITVNVSSPNTPELRDLQAEDPLSELLEALTAQNKLLGAKPLLVKVAPDLSSAEVRAISDICISLGVSGVIATNTTITRPGIDDARAAKIGAGGLSGRPLAKLAKNVVSAFYKASDGKLPIIGVGGIFTGEDAYEMIAAGASLIQAYTGFVYGGPTFAYDLCRELAEMIESRGFASIDELVGSAA